MATGLSTSFSDKFMFPVSDVSPFIFKTPVKMEVVSYVTQVLMILQNKHKLVIPIIDPTGTSSDTKKLSAEPPFSK